MLRHHALGVGGPLVVRSGGTLSDARLAIPAVGGISEHRELQVAARSARCPLRGMPHALSGTTLLAARAVGT